jgi:hypothetical protein
MLEGPVDEGNDLFRVTQVSWQEMSLHAGFPEFFSRPDRLLPGFTVMQQDGTSILGYCDSDSSSDAPRGSGDQDVLILQ